MALPSSPRWGAIVDDWNDLVVKLLEPAETGPTEKDRDPHLYALAELVDSDLTALLAKAAAAETTGPIDAALAEFAWSRFDELAATYTPAELALITARKARDGEGLPGREAPGLQRERA